MESSLAHNAKASDDLLQNNVHIDEGINKSLDDNAQAQTEAETVVAPETETEVAPAAKAVVAPGAKTMVAPETEIAVALETEVVSAPEAEATAAPETEVEAETEAEIEADVNATSSNKKKKKATPKKSLPKKLDDVDSQSVNIFNSLFNEKFFLHVSLKAPNVNNFQKNHPECCGMIHISDKSTFYVSMILEQNHLAMNFMLVVECWHIQSVSQLFEECTLFDIEVAAIFTPPTPYQNHTNLCLDNLIPVKQVYFVIILQKGHNFQSEELKLLEDVFCRASRYYNMAETLVNKKIHIQSMSAS